MLALADENAFGYIVFVLGRYKRYKRLVSGSFCCIAFEPRNTVDRLRFEDWFLSVPPWKQQHTYVCSRLGH